MTNEKMVEVNLGIKLIQNTNGLTYGTDAYLLAAYLPTVSNSFAVEIGSGSGIISLLAMQKNKFSKIYCVEIQKYYSELCQKNIELNGMTEKLESVNCDIRNCDIRNAEVVFSNPPFMKVNAGKSNIDDGKNSARHEVNGDINEICASASKILKYGGRLCCVYRPDRLTDLMSAMRNAGIEPKKMTFVHSDIMHIPCLVLITGKKGGKSGVEITRPLILNEVNSDKYTKDTEYLYSGCEWPI